MLVLLGYLSVCLLTPITQKSHVLSREYSQHLCTWFWKDMRCVLQVARGQSLLWDAAFRSSLSPVGCRAIHASLVDSLLPPEKLLTPHRFPFSPGSQIPVGLRALPTSEVSTHGCPSVTFPGSTFWEDGGQFWKGLGLDGECLFTVVRTFTEPSWQNEFGGTVQEGLVFHDLARMNHAHILLPKFVLVIGILEMSRCIISPRGTWEGCFPFTPLGYFDISAWVACLKKTKYLKIQISKLVH